MVSIGYPEAAAPTSDSNPAEPTNTAPISSPLSDDRDPRTTANNSNRAQGSEPEQPFAVPQSSKAPLNYNSSVIVDRDGEIKAHYRKSFLYYTDVTWSRPGPGFHAGTLSLTPHSQNGETVGQDIKLAAGICMDLNPHRFVAPWGAKEFAHHVLDSRATLVILTMAWLSSELCPFDVSPDNADSQNPDMPTLAYWIERLRPVVDGESEVVVVFANRAGVEGASVYAGSSCVMKLGGGRVALWGVVGKGEERCLVVDTDEVSWEGDEGRRRC